MSASATVLRKAAEIYRRNGRFAGDFYDVSQYYGEGLPQGQCRVCVMGAVYLAAGLTPLGGGAVSQRLEAEAALKAFAGDLGWVLDLGKHRQSERAQIQHFLVQWHDQGDGSSVEAVEAALLHAAESEAS